MDTHTRKITQKLTLSHKQNKGNNQLLTHIEKSWAKQFIHEHTKIQT